MLFGDVTIRQAGYAEVYHAAMVVARVTQQTEHRRARTLRRAGKGVKGGRPVPVGRFGTLFTCVPPWSRLVM